jgi:hypothetical protein
MSRNLCKFLRELYPRRVFLCQSIVLLVEIIESLHWKRKKPFRKNIESFMIEWVIVRSKKHERDKHHSNALNASAVIPHTGRKLKVVFRKIGKDRIKLITEYYLDT